MLPGQRNLSPASTTLRRAEMSQKTSLHNCQGFQDEIDAFPMQRKDFSNPQSRHGRHDDDRSNWFSTRCDESLYIIYTQELMRSLTVTLKQNGYALRYCISSRLRTWIHSTRSEARTAAKMFCVAKMERHGSRRRISSDASYIH